LQAITSAFVDIHEGNIAALFVKGRDYIRTDPRCAAGNKHGSACKISVAGNRHAWRAFPSRHSDAI
jgi:hypothetical protein